MLKSIRSLFPANLSALNPDAHWRKALWQLMLGLLILFGIYFDTVTSITSIWWRSDTFAHGLLITPFTLYMIWTQRKALANMQPVTSIWGPIVFIPTVVLWLLGSAVDVLVIQQIALLGMVWSMILGMLGWQVVRSILFPLVFLVFAIPLGEGLIPILMDITAVFTVKALVLSGFPVYWEGMVFIIPSGSFEVAKACSGIRYLFASVALGSLFAYINYQTIWKRTVFIVLSILLPIIANGLRAYGIVLIAHYSGMQYAVDVDHLIYGWLFFGLIMFLLFYIGSRWREDVRIQKNELTFKKNHSVVQSNILLLILLVLALLGPAGTLWIQREEVDITQRVLLAPKENGEWKKNQKLATGWGIDFKGETHSVNAAYTNDDNHVIQIHIAYYANESQDFELINQNNHFYNIKRWTQVQRRRSFIELNNGRKIDFQQIILQAGHKKRILWYWYDLNGYTTPDKYVGKLIQAGTRLLGTDQGGVVVALITDLQEQNQPSIQSMKSFIKVMYPAIESSITGVRGVDQ